MKINAKIDNKDYNEIEKITAGGKEINLSATQNLQEKITTVNGEITPDSGYDGLSKVTVNVSGGSTPTGSQTFTSNGTYDVTNIAQAIVNVSGGGNIDNVETGTVTVTEEDVTNKKFSFELQNAADMVLVYPTFQQENVSSVPITIFLMFNKAMVKFLGSTEAVSELSNQVYGVGSRTTANTLLTAVQYPKGEGNTNGIFDKTVNVDLGTSTNTLVAGTYKFIAFRGVVQ